ncbi:flagellar hook-length control protein FliK [Cohnella hongkongensis]|uniref:Flagellar hook-length control protein FliK n=1 Tax=Cohnella hongkongensis TaxID=178337 RepID=A0ABV9FD33_9BACL
MNMVITSAPTTVAQTTTPAAGGAQGASQGGSGFAGALVQAIDGGASAQTGESGGGMSLPVGLTGLIGTAGALDSLSETQDLLALLENLAEQLTLLEQPGTELSAEAQEQLAAMLAVLQGLLDQLRQAQPTADTALMNAADAGHTVDIALNTTLSKPLVQTLRDVVAQLTEAIASGKETPEQAAAATGPIKAALDTLVSITAASSAAKEAKAGEAELARSTGKADNALNAGAAVAKEAAAQTSSSSQEARRPVQALRDPVWRFQVTAAAETANTGAQTVDAPEPTAASESRPVWTLMQNDRLLNAEAPAAKAPTPMPTPVPIQQFAEQMGKYLVKQFQLTQGNGISEAKLTLTPQHLGQVDIRIVMNNGVLTAQFIADNPAAKELLENQMAQLRASLSGQGLQVERLEVVQQSSASEGATLQQQEHRNSNSGREGGSKGRGSDEGNEESAVFSAELERSSSLKEIGYGSSINVTA